MNPPGERPWIMNEDLRTRLVEKFKRSELIESCGEADRIFKYFIIYGHEGLFNIRDYLSRLQKMTITGLSNNDVDRLLNEIFDDENGYYAYKIGLVKEIVDGIEIDSRQYDMFCKFISFLKTNQQRQRSRHQ
ncbi:MAG TPA: hypothetical protein ENO00_14065 [Deltaproteobacteria bacterium]|nr:hypothetical protein [Deltaproteobacteria bacterium]